MNKTQHLAELLTLPAAEFGRYVESVNQLARLRRNVESAGASPPASPEPAPPAKAAKAATRVAPSAAALPKPLAARPPMRAPKPGTLRGEIHGILRAAGKPMRRAELIAAVAKGRGQPVDEILTAKVGEIVRNPHDPFLRRVAYGTYGFVAKEDACL